MTFKTITEVCEAVKAGKVVHWGTRNYVVILDNVGQWLIGYNHGQHNASYVGLFWLDGVTTDYNPEDFFVAFTG